MLMSHTPRMWLCMYVAIFVFLRKYMRLNEITSLEWQSDRISVLINGNIKKRREKEKERPSLSREDFPHQKLNQQIPQSCIPRIHYCGRKNNVSTMKKKGGLDPGNIIYGGSNLINSLQYKVKSSKVKTKEIKNL